VLLFILSAVVVVVLMELIADRLGLPTQVPHPGSRC